MSATKLVNACKNDVFPDISTITKYGLDGCGGTNPMSIFSCYREAITKEGITGVDIDTYFNSGKINQLILENSSAVKYLECYEKVLQKGGIKTSWDLPQIECAECKKCSNHAGGTCSNCGETVKK